MSVRDLMTEALACATKEEAEHLIDREMARMQPEMPLRSIAELRSIVKANIGYCSGYYDRETAARLLNLFECEHPIFGKMEDWPKTPEATLELGFKLGEAMKQRKQNGLVSTGVENRTV